MIGICICPIHGRSGISAVCAHIQQDVLAGITVRPFRTFNVEKPGSLPLYFCEECGRSHSLPPSETVIPFEEWNCDEGEAALLDTTGVCEACFKKYSGLENQIEPRPEFPTFDGGPADGAFHHDKYVYDEPKIIRPAKARK